MFCMKPSDFESTVESDVDIYDSEHVALEAVLRKIQSAVGTRTNLEDFRQRIMAMFHRVGFLTDVRVFEARREGDTEDCFMFKVVITGRVNAEAEFDHDRQQYEVIHDVLGLKDHDGPKKTKVSMHTDQSSLTRTTSGLYLPGK
jgi:hypothetical protein